MEVKDVVNYLGESIRILELEDYGIQPQEVALVLQEFTQILGINSYRWCNGRFSSNYSSTALDQFSNANYQLEFEWGYKD